MLQLIKKSLLVLCLTVLITPVASAKEIKLIKEGHVPTAEEMANILLSNTPDKASNKIKTRSVSFGVAKKSEPVSLGLPIKFDYDSSVLNKSSLDYLKQLGTMLNLEKMANETIMIEGHTDAKGSEQYNMDLSKKRSQAVRDFLISNYQIAPSRIKTTGKGESSPLPNKSKFDPLNRRVEFFRIL